jgi:hypothetical protein
MVRQVSHFLLVFDRPHSRLLREDPYQDHREALVARFKAERLYRHNPDVEIVVLSAESSEDLRRTHSRYFQSTSALASPSSRKTTQVRAARHATP